MFLLVKNQRFVRKERLNHIYMLLSVSHPHWMMVSGPLFQGGGKFIIKKQIPLISHKHIVPIILVLLFAANSLCRQSYQLADGLRPQLHGEYDLHKIRKTLDWVNSPDRKLILHPSPCNDDGKRYKRPHTSQATTFPVFQQKKAFPIMMTIDLMTSITRQMKHNLKSSIKKLCVNWDPPIQLHIRVQFMWHELKLKAKI